MFRRLRHGTTRTVLLGLAACLILLGGFYLAGEASSLQTSPSLGAASSFAVLGGSTVTNTGATTVNGNLGVSPGSAVTGFPPGTVVGGTIHAADALAASAQADTTTAYNDLVSQPCTADLTGQDLGGKTLTAGVYCFSTSAQLTGALTLNAQGNANAVFVFKIGSTLTTASGSSVLLINGGSPCNVFWQVGSSATVGTTTTFLGNILALTSITLNTGAGVSGRALARNGAVTMDTNTVGSAGCAAGVATATATLPPATQTAVIAATSTAVTAATPTAAVAATGPASAPCLGSIRGSKVDGAGAGLPGWTIQLLRGNDIVKTTVTDRDGNFDFLDLGMGPYTVREAQRAGWTAQGQTSVAVTLTACGQNLTGYRFVNVQTAGTPATTPTAATPSGGTPARPPPAMPRTGAGPPPLDLFSLLLGGLAVAVGLTMRRARK